MCLLSFSFYMSINILISSTACVKKSSERWEPQIIQRTNKCARWNTQGPSSMVRINISWRVTRELTSPSRSSQALSTSVGVSYQGQKHTSQSRSSPLDFRTNTKPVVFPATNGQPPIYIPANTKCVFSVWGLPRWKGNLSSQTVASTLWWTCIAARISGAQTVRVIVYPRHYHTLKLRHS